MKFRIYRKLRSDILIAFSVLICITVACEIIYSSFTHKRLILDFEKEYYSKTVTKTAANYLDSYFNQLEVVLEVLANDFDESAQDKFYGFDKLFLESLKNIQCTSSFYITLKNGEVLQARTAENLKTTQKSGNNELLPQNTKYALRKISPSPGSKEFIETWTYLNDGFKEIYHESVPSTTNFTKRDWYLKAENNKTKVWSDAYVFATAQSTGVTLSIPLGYDDHLNATGVLCVDFAFDHFKKILQSIQANECSRTYLINSKNEILASSCPDDQSYVTDKENPHKLTLVKLTNSTDPIIDGAAKAIFGSDEDHTNFNVQDTEYVVAVKKLTRLPFSVLTITPQDLFTSLFEDVTRKMMLLFAFIFLFSTIIILILSHRIAKPITMLRDSAKAIGAMDLENYPTPPKSNILEIKQLSNAMDAMKLNITTFTKYAPRDLVNKLAAEGILPKLGGKTEQITILFSDIEKFSTIAENLPAEYLILHLSEYFDELTKEIMKCNGVIDKYMGDSIMAMWGAPKFDENHITNACIAGLKCQYLLDILQDKWKTLGKPSFPTRIGIHSGPAVVGNIGSQDRMNFTTIGDVVNTASRLEGANKYYGTRILASEDIEAASRGKILFRIIDKIAVKGRRSGITVFEPLCLLEVIGGDKYYSLIDLCAKSKDAFELYQNRHFDEAIKFYSIILKGFPWIQQSISPVINNCKKYLDGAPDDWDGINFLEGK
ncbi:MAG: adenylate/guanylate cyclase domain-containing protein [Holosporales bacterium]|jgi:adenylate cyclase|nr:adenylate/guanylate cyclase domain-containing protein [Holosporales bacterium]